MLRPITVAVILALGMAVSAEPQPKPKFKAMGIGKRKGPGPGMRPEAFEKFRKLSPDERKAALQNLPPERREMMERRLEQWEKMTPEQRQRLDGSYARFQEMTPEKQQEVRQLFRRFSETFPAEKRPQAQHAVRRLQKAANDVERKKILDSKRYQQQFSEDERKLIEQMAADLPERP